MNSHYILPVVVFLAVAHAMAAPRMNLANEEARQQQLQQETRGCMQPFVDNRGGHGGQGRFGSGGNGGAGGGNGATYVIPAPIASVYLQYPQLPPQPENGLSQGYAAYLAWQQHQEDARTRVPAQTPLGSSQQPGSAHHEGAGKLGGFTESARHDGSVADAENESGTQTEVA